MLNPSSFITTNPLEELSIRYSNDYANKACAMKLFTPHIVSKKVGKFYSYSKDNLRIKTLDAPSGTEAPRGTYSVRTKTYTCKEKAFKGLVLEKDARDFDKPVADLDQEQAMQNMDALMLELEDAAHTKATTSGNYPSANVTTLSAGDTWADEAGDPFEDIRATRQAVWLTSLKRPNIMCLSQTGLDYLKLHPAIIDRLKYTSNESVTAEMLARLFELDEICVSDCGKNTALEGAADVMASVWDDDAVLAYRDPSARLKSMTYGKLFLAEDFYVKTLDKPELGRGKGAHEIESGWEYTLESAATESSSSDDFVAGGLIINIY